ncbi:MAG: hypothetical protein BAJALOKI2v1_1040006 [Promethearchaeota archaeon]|nr:MAG: hypothetical protein BAJALOKI2v1_1040006 [Candidatus Lokiarchaeota archaeon]
MTKGKKDFMTVGQIDSTGVRGPHEKELNDISNAKYHLFENISEDNLKSIVYDDIGGKLEDIGFNEDWTITKEFFPEAEIHMSYFYYGDEFGDIEGEFKFLFSGDHISWIPGEDSATYIDILMDFMERRIKGKEPFEKDYDSKTELMEKVLEQRVEPFSLLKKEDVEPLEDFMGADVQKQGEEWTFSKEVFPKIFIKLTYLKKEGLDIGYHGENLEKMGSYHIELVGIFVLNHILRYITIHNQEKDLPQICYQMFSRYYTKLKDWPHRSD